MDAAARVPEHEHPLIAELRRDPATESSFWRDIAARGTPLVEPDPASAQHSLVTYLWRLGPDADHVVVQPAGFPDPPDHLLTRVPGTATCHATYRYRNDARLRYAFVPDLPVLSWEDADELLNAFIREHPPLPDPNNPNQVATPFGQTSLLELANAPDESLIRKRSDIARGSLDKSQFTSRILGNDRNLWVYTPPGYGESTEACSVLLLLDGGWYLSLIPTHRILDNLFADGRIGRVVAVFIENVTATSRNVELACNEQFARFVDEELLPWLRANYRVSDDPADHHVAGSSLGGLGAAWLGYRLPHAIGNVISQAGVFWWGPGYQWGAPHSRQSYEAEWLTQRFRASPRLPLRFWMEIGLLDSPRMLDANRRMKAVIEDVGYDIAYREFCGGHDFVLWRGTLAQALATLLPRGSGG